MFVADYDEDQGGFHDARIIPFGPIEMDPASMVLHYAQETFEGLKAYKTDDGRILLFRPNAMQLVLQIQTIVCRCLKCLKTCLLKPSKNL